MRIGLYSDARQDIIQMHKEIKRRLETSNWDMKALGIIIRF